MRLLVLVLVLGAAAFGQHRPSRGIQARPANPAAVIPPGNVNPFFPGATTHAQRLGAAVSGYPGFTLGPAPFIRRNPPFLVFGAGMPGWWGGGGFAAPLQPNVTIVNATPSPAVIVNPDFQTQRARPAIQEFAPSGLPESERFRSYHAPIPSHPEGVSIRGSLTAPAEPILYLVALKDSSIQSAVAVWREGSELHYMTPKHEHRKVSLTLVDPGLTERLNRERGVTLPQPVR